MGKKQISPEDFEEFGIKEGYFIKENGQCYINTASTLNYITFLDRLKDYMSNKNK